MSDTRPATDEEVKRWQDGYGTSPSPYAKPIQRLLARLAAAEEMCRDLQQSVDGMAHERLALETKLTAAEAELDKLRDSRWYRERDEELAATRAENARLREMLLDVAECSWCATRFTPDSGWPCEKCKDARRLLEAKP